MEREVTSLCSRWRVDDHYAICHLVEVPNTNYEMTQFSELEDDADFCESVEKELSTQYAYPDLQRGDLIFIRSHVGTRNEGKMVYDGRRVIPLEYIMDDYGNIPASFQAVVEFPPSYWTGFLTHSPIVPFSFSQHIPDPRMEEIRGYNRQWAFPMIGINCEVFAIFSHPHDQITKEEFLAKLQTTNYYESYESANYTFTLPPDVRADNVLVLPKIETPKKKASSDDPEKDDLESIWVDSDFKEKNKENNNYTRIAWGRSGMLPRTTSMETLCSRSLDREQRAMSPSEETLCPSPCEETIRGDRPKYRRDAEDSDSDYYGEGSGYETDDTVDERRCGFTTLHTHHKWADEA